MTNKLTKTRKSEVAMEYALHFREKSPEAYVFWVPASTREQFEEACCDLANRLQLSGRDDPDIYVPQLVHDWLLELDNSQWLMVLDNADDMNLFYPTDDQSNIGSPSVQKPLASYLPQAPLGTILITSRNGSLAQRLTGHHMNVKLMIQMSEGQAEQLVQSKFPTDCDGGIGPGLARALDCNPLAITQAAQYILHSTPPMMPSLYVREFSGSDEKKTSLLDEHVSDSRDSSGVNDSLFMRWITTFQSIMTERPSAINLLAFMSFCNPNSILKSLIEYPKRYDCENGRCLRPRSGVKADDEYGRRLEKDLELLLDYSLVILIIYPEQRVYKISSLVQLCMRAWLSSVQAMEIHRHTFLHVLSDMFPKANVEDWTTCQQLDHHVPRIAQIRDQMVLNKRDGELWAELLTNQGAFWAAFGRNESAVPVLREAVSVRTEILGREHEKTVRSMHYLAAGLDELAQYQEAEQLSRYVVKRRMKMYGNDHQDTLESRLWLAHILKNQKKHEEAEREYRPALQVSKELHGIKHPKTLHAYTNFAVLLRARRKYEEAEQLHRFVFETLRESFDMDHPEVLTAVNDLGLVIKDQHRYDEAEKMFRQVVKGDENQFSKNAEIALTCLRNLGSVLTSQERYEGAEKILRQVYEGRKQLLTPDHPDIFCSLNDLGVALYSLKRFEEAEVLCRQAAKKREELLGKEDQSTLNSRRNLAAILAMRGKDAEAEAEELYRDILKATTELLGEDHLDTISTLSGYSYVLLTRGKYKEAEKIQRQELRILEKQLDVNNLKRLSSTHSLAVILSRQNRREEAAKYCRIALEGYNKVLGPNNPKTQRCQHDYTSLGRRVGEKESQITSSGKEKSQVFRRFKTLWSGKKQNALSDNTSGPDQDSSEAAPPEKPT